MARSNAPSKMIGLIMIALFLITRQASEAQNILPIGAIQGAADVSPYLNRFVNFRGVVVGRYEDENTRGDVYYTLFVQSLPDETDGDPATSDGIAVFLGRQPRPDIPLGAVVTVGGKVTEFFGLTEMDDDGLVVTMEQPAGALPEPILIDPPPDMAEHATYFEALEGMRVAYDGAAIVAGPTHEGCGFAVIGEAAATDLPIIRQADGEPVGHVVPVLYPSDLRCDDIPQVKTGDRVTGLTGALTYNFDQFKIVFDAAEQLAIEHVELSPVPSLPAFGPRAIVIATLNAEDYFDTARDTDEEGEPVLSEEDLAARRAKLTHLITRVLNCPTLIGLQEIEHAALLDDLSAVLSDSCGFTYEVSHLDSPDARGIDNGLLSDPRRVLVRDVALRQTCSPVPTEITDGAITCPGGEEPLFGRPPLQIEADIDGEPYTLFVNHFKSKRGGEIETDLERIRQAVYLNGLAAERLDADPTARLIALGDFNDTPLSPARALLADPAQGGRFVSALAVVPEETRYSYNFGGVSELIDDVLLSPTTAEAVGWATILHTNADFPVGWRLDTSPERLAFRVTDHDIPIVMLGELAADGQPSAVAPTAIAAVESPTPTATNRSPTAEPPSTTAVVDVEAVPAAQPPIAEPQEAVGGRPSAVIRPAVVIGVALAALAVGVFLRARR